MKYILRLDWREDDTTRIHYMADNAIATRSLCRAMRFNSIDEAAEYAVKVEPSACWLVAYETGELLLCRSRYTPCDSVADALETGFDWWCNSDVTEFAIERKDNGRVVLVTEHPLPPRGLTPKSPNWENTPEAWLSQFDRMIAAIQQS